MNRISTFLFLVILAATALTACIHHSDDSAAHAQERGTDDHGPKLMFETVELRDALHAMCVSGALPKALRHRDTLLTMYRDRDYQPLWVQGEVYPGRIQSILPYLTQAHEHGLDPAWYHSGELLRLFTLTLQSNVQPVERMTALARLEILLSDALLDYARHLRFGIFDPRAIDAAYHLPVRQPSHREFIEPLSTTNITAYLRNIQPSERRYRDLQQALLEWRSMQVSHGWVSIPSPGRDKIEHGDTSFILPYVAHRLFMTGELQGLYTAPSRLLTVLDHHLLKAYELDSNRIAAIGPIEYDSTLVRAVLRYQQRHGLLADGILGARSIARLNRRVDDYIEQMERTLERFRWVRYPEQGRYVLVNIPAFWLYAMDNGETMTDMAVCTGLPSALSYDPAYARLMRETNQRYDRKNYETPQMHSVFSHLIINPVWNVPHSIGTRETYFSALKDPNYLSKRGYRVYLRDSLVDHTQINWQQYNPRTLPYRFAQAPGRANALGTIKFMFNNEFSIYLHDTPQRWAFNRAVRAVSHGCVRIENPMAFADFLLGGNEDWNVDRVQQLIYAGGGSRTVHLNTKTPLYIDYFTSWVNSEGIVQFRDDVYHKDALLARAFESFSRRRAVTH
jgi:L,D-transpeptidase YcbB